MAGTSLYTCSVIDVQAAAPVAEVAENPNLEQLAEIQEQAAADEEEAPAVEAVAEPEVQAGDITDPISLTGVTKNAAGKYEAAWDQIIQIKDSAADHYYTYEIKDKDNGLVSTGDNEKQISLNKSYYNGTLKITQNSMAGGDPVDMEIQITAVDAAKAGIVRFKDPSVETTGISYNSDTEGKLRPAIIVSDNDKTYMESMDYETPQYSNYDVVGNEATATVRFNNSDTPYKGTVVKKYKIISNVIQGVSMNVTGAHRYTGAEQGPKKGDESLTVTVSGGNQSVLKPEDYNIVWDNDKNVGSATAKVTLTGAGNRFSPANQAFDLTDVFTISKNNTAKFALSFKDDKSTYPINTSMNEISKNVIVKDGASTVSPGDYNVVCSFNSATVSGDYEFKNMGDYKLWIEGTRNYDGTKVHGELPFSIGGIQVSADAIKVSYNTSANVYDGTKQTLKNLKVSVNGVESGQPVSQDNMVEDRDYTVTYTNNTDAASSNAAEAPTAVIELISGNYKGSTKTVSFNIEQADINAAYGSPKADETKFIYDGGKHISSKVTLTKKNANSSYEITDKDYDVVISGNVAGAGTVSGSYWCDVSANVSGNYKGKIAESIKCEIERKSISSDDITGFDVDGKSYGYTGSQVIPPFTLTYETSQLDNKVLSSGDYEVIPGENIDGEGTIEVTGSGNYCGTLKATFTIGDPHFTSVLVSTNNRISYTGKTISAADLAPWTKVMSDGTEVSSNYYVIVCIRGLKPSP